MIVVVAGFLASFTGLFLGRRRPATGCSRMRKMIGYFPVKFPIKQKFYQKKYMYTDKIQIHNIIITGHIQSYIAS